MKRSRSFFTQLLTLALLAMLPLLGLLAHDVYSDAVDGRRTATDTVRRSAAAVAMDAQATLERAQQFLDALAQRPEIRALDAERCQALMSNWVKLDPLWANVGVAAQDGRRVCSSGSSPGPATYAGVPWFEQALASDGFTTSPPLAGRISNRSVSVLALPLRDAQGKRLGLVALSLDLALLTQRLSQLPMPPSGMLGIVDANSVVLARVPEVQTLVGADASERVTEFKRTHDDGLGVTTGIDGVSRLYAIALVPNQGWVAVAGIPVEQVYAQARSDLRARLLAAGLAGVLAMTLAWVIARRLAAPLEGLARTADAVAAGNGAARAPSTGSGEIEAVAQAFNRMLDAQDRAEQRAARLAGFYATLSRTNRAIVRIHEPGPLFEEICRICVETGHAKLALIGMLDGKRLVRVGSCGPVHEFLQESPDSLDLSRPEAADTPTALALSEGRRQVSNDYLAEVRTTPLRESAQRLGLKAIAVFPIRRGGEVAGTLNLYVGETGFFDEALLDLLDEMAADLSFALDNIDREAARGAAVRQSEADRERFARIFQGSPVSIVLQAYPNGPVLDVNEAFCERFGRPREQVVGKTSAELGITMSRPAWESLSRQLQERGRARDLETQVRYTTLGTRDMLINAELIALHGQTCLLTISNDITDRKRMEAELRESLERFRLASATGNVWSWRIAESNTFISEPLKEMLGYPIDTRMADTPQAWAPLLHPDDVQRFRSVLVAHVKERKPFDIEFRLRHHDGHFSWLHARGQAVWNEQGRAVHMAGTLFDISARRDAQQALEEREQQLAGIVDSAMDAIVTVDATQRIVVFNHAASAMFQVPAAQAIGSSLECFIPQHQQLLQAPQAGAATARALTGVRPNGERFPIEASVSTIGSGERQLMTMVMRDVTEARATEHARRARLAAEAASRAKTEFLSRMSHELRTPLNAVLGFTQLLESDRRDPLSPGQRRQVDLVRQAGWHLMALINDVLDVSRIEAGQMKLDVHEVGLGPLLDEVLSLGQAQAQAQGIRIEAAYREQGPIVVQADPVRLRQAMLNLLSNATKYNKPGGWVRLGMQRVGERVRIDVADSGIGLSAEQLGRLFEPFNRLGREHGDIEGTGIGLALTRQLVELMEGEISVDSTTGQGTTVSVYLPCVAEGQATTAFGEFSATQPAPLGDEPGGTVLYIEDNPVNVLVVEQCLSRWPALRFVTTEDGRSGLEQARSLQPDLILVDMHLPDMDGLQVLDELRRDPATRRLRVVALSASAMADEVAAARARGALDYWTKPIELKSFLAGVRELLARR